MTNLENSRAGCGGALAVPAQVGGSSASAPGSPLRGVRNDEFGEFAGRLRGALAVPAQVGGSSASAPGSPLRGVRNDKSLCCCPVQRRVATLVSITKLSSFRTRRSRDPEPRDFCFAKASETRVPLQSSSASYRSCQYGFCFSTSSSFHLRFHPLMAFSRAIADSMVECCSNQTR